MPILWYIQSSKAMNLESIIINFNLNLFRNKDTVYINLCQNNNLDSNLEPLSSYASLALPRCLSSRVDWSSHSCLRETRSSAKKKSKIYFIFKYKSLKQGTTKDGLHCKLVCIFKHWIRISIFTSNYIVCFTSYEYQTGLRTLFFVLSLRTNA